MKLYPVPVHLYMTAELKLSHPLSCISVAAEINSWVYAGLIPPPGR
jgi:hypothetical protein